MPCKNTMLHFKPNSPQSTKYYLAKLFKAPCRLTVRAQIHLSDSYCFCYALLKTLCTASLAVVITSF